MSLETKTNTVQNDAGKKDSSHWGNYSAQEVWNFLNDFSLAGNETRVFLITNKRELAEECLEYGKQFHRLQQEHIHNNKYQKLRDYMDSLNKTKFKKHQGFRSLENE